MKSIEITVTNGEKEAVLTFYGSGWAIDYEGRLTTEHNKTDVFMFLKDNELINPDEELSIKQTIDIADATPIEGTVKQ